MNEVIENREEEKIKKKIDFKIVTFSLGGKEYAIDIMKVKEILKENRFTMVPNTLPFVKGVYNLRGEIIPIIDLREMFMITVEEDAEKEKDILILRLPELVLGVVVDAIDKVVGIAKEDIQPPHPLFGDVNVKYISGVVEVEGKLYIILDVDRIFGEEEVLSASYGKKKEEITERVERVTEVAKPAKQDEELDFSFIKDTLIALKSFYITEVNYEWARRRYREWSDLRREASEPVQLESVKDAEEFLKPFFSPYTSKLWGDDYHNNLLALLPDEYSGVIQVWDIGCGKGYEAYSIACILREKYGKNVIKVWANDSDLLNISMAPNLVLSQVEIPQYFIKNNFVEKYENDYRFKREIKDLIVFEYHDITHLNEYPEMDLIVARDLISFLPPEEQKRMIAEFSDSLKSQGYLMLGENEVPIGSEWKRVSEGNVVLYRKE